MLGSNTHLAFYGKNKTDVYVLDVCETGVQWVSHWVKQAGRTPDSLLLEPWLLRLRQLLLPGWGPWGPGHRHVDLCSLPISQITIPPHLSLSLSDLSRAFPFRHARANHTGKQRRAPSVTLRRRRRKRGGRRTEDKGGKEPNLKRTLSEQCNLKRTHA